MQTFNYKWLHIPTGLTESRTWGEGSRIRFLEDLATWNRSNPGVWQYYEER